MDRIKEGTIGSVGSALGGGGFGIVRQVKYKGTVAAEKIIKNASWNPVNLDILSRLSHPNLSHTLAYEYRKEDNSISLHLVFPMEEKDLYYYDPKGNETVISIMFQALSALKFLHDNKYLHLDIKPANILLRNLGAPLNISAKLADFDLALYNPDGVKKSIYVSKYGTMAYLPTEFWRGTTTQVNYATDIWMLGLTFFHAIVGTRNEYVVRLATPVERFRAIEKKTYADYIKLETEMLDVHKADYSSESIMTALTKLYGSGDKTRLLGTLLTNMLNPDPNSRSDAGILMRNPIFSNFVVPTGSMVKVNRFKRLWRFNEETKNILDKILKNLQNDYPKMPLECFFLCLDLILRFWNILSQEATGNSLQILADGAIQIGLDFFEIKNRTPLSREASLQIPEFINRLQGIIRRTNMYDTAAGLEELIAMYNKLKSFKWDPYDAVSFTLLAQEANDFIPAEKRFKPKNIDLISFPI